MTFDQKCNLLGKIASPWAGWVDAGLLTGRGLLEPVAVPLAASVPEPGAPTLLPVKVPLHAEILTSSFGNKYKEIQLLAKLMLDHFITNLFPASRSMRLLVSCHSLQSQVPGPPPPLEGSSQTWIQHIHNLKTMELFIFCSLFPGLSFLVTFLI